MAGLADAHQVCQPSKPRVGCGSSDPIALTPGASDERVAPHRRIARRRQAPPDSPTRLASAQIDIGSVLGGFAQFVRLRTCFRFPEVGFRAQGGLALGKRPRYRTGKRPRPRHFVRWPLGTILGVTLFRYSDRRRAYVLRGVGRRWGPVLREY